MQQTLTYPGGTRRGLVAGLAVSLLLHVALLVWLRAPTAPPPPRDERRWTEPLSVRLLPPPVAAQRETEPEPRPARRESRPTRTPRAVQAHPRDDERRPITVVPTQPAEPAPAEEAGPKFDPDAARAAARAIAGDLDPPAKNWAAEKLNQGKEWKETKEERLGRNIANSARPDCKTAYAGAGLLAPLLMLADKKDSGCKF